MKAACSVENCECTSIKRGLCNKHYQRLRKYGDASFLATTPNGAASAFMADNVLAYEGDDCVIWPFSRNRGGYATFNKGLATRFVCEKTHGPAPTLKHEAAHSCGNGMKGCLTKRHLLWKTRAENERDKVSHGTSNRGERSAHAKLTNEQVAQIKTLFGTMNDPAIARQFYVSVTTIREIRIGKRWAWMQEGEAA